MALGPEQVMYYVLALSGEPPDKLYHFETGEWQHIDEHIIWL